MDQNKDTVPNSLKDIGYFRVTDRSLDEYKKFNHIDMERLPKNATVVDIGSGTFQKFSKELADERPDLKVISIDASLALPPIEHGVYSKTGEISYHHHNPENNEIERVNEDFRKKRLKNKQPNTLAAVLPNIPLKENSADLIIDSFGPAMYLDDEKHNKYFSEIIRVLKKGGSAHLYPIDTIDEFIGSKPEETSNRINIATKRIEKILKHFKKDIEQPRYYEQQDKNLTTRPGLIITKK